MYRNNTLGSRVDKNYLLIHEISTKIDVCNCLALAFQFYVFDRKSKKLSTEFSQ